MFAAEIVAMFGKSMRFSSPIHANPPPRPEAAAWPRKTAAGFFPLDSFLREKNQVSEIRRKKSLTKGLVNYLIYG